MDAMLTVVSKVLVMLIMIAVGYLITKKGLLTERGAAEITSILIRVVTPCLIIDSFLSGGDLEPLELLLATVISALAIVLSILLSLPAFRKEPPERRKVLRFAIIFSNAGFMGIPLVQGIVGEKGVVYGSFFIAVFNVICWTYGYRMMNSSAKVSLRTVLFNPGIIGLVIALPLYFLGVELPAVAAEPIGFFSDLNTPLAMLVIGSYIAKVDPALLRLRPGGVQDGRLPAGAGPGGVPGVPAVHPPLGGAAGHQRHPGQLPCGGQHRALRRAVRRGLPAGLQDRGPCPRCSPF